MTDHTCATCAHARTTWSDDDDAPPIPDTLLRVCTAYPVWVLIGVTHYCGQYKPAPTA